MARVDDPVTDVVFVCSEENCPRGYTLISKCPCGHEAQLWEKVYGGKEGTRFLCFTKEDKDGTVIEEMYIPRRTAYRLRPGFKIVPKTVEGKEPMYHRQLAVKRVERSKANKVVADVIVCRGRDKVSKMYKRLDKANGLRICFRQAVYTPPTTQPEPENRGARRASDSDTHPKVKLFEDEELRNRRATLGMEALGGRMDHLLIEGEIESDDDHSHYTPSPQSSPSPSPTPETGFPDYPTGTADSYDTPVTMTIDRELQSVPPPSQTTPASSSNYYPTPTPAQDQSSGSSFYPPTSAYPLPPQQQTASYNYAQPPRAGYSTQPTSYGQPTGFTGGYPSSQPPTAAPGYASVAGSAFMGATLPTRPSGPAPFNPFQQGTAAPYPPPTNTYPPAPAGTSTYPPLPPGSGTYPPPPTGTATYPPPPVGRGTYPPPPSGQNYGFNF